MGFTIFAIGLFKKVILADNIAGNATPVFEFAESGMTLTLFEAWGGALAYTFQLYFDFSGYSDMAIGLARMFGIRLPLNFNSPYKATSIIEFWRRWHITLSRFLREYLYIPLGGNRKGESRRLLSLMTTMLLGGLWHGAGWTFVLWGGLHGVYLVINHAWRKIRVNFFKPEGNGSKIGQMASWTITLFALVVAWVPFRAESMKGASNMFSSMIGVNGVSLPPSWEGKLGSVEIWFVEHGAIFDGMFHNGVFTTTQPWGLREVIGIVALLIFTGLLPNTQQIMRRYRPALETYKDEIPYLRYRWMGWRPSLPWVIFTACIFTSAILGLTKVSEFLYFQF
ncbi:MAG: MBOAT family O-acyltransferase [Nitrospinales bacterium]